MQRSNQYLEFNPRMKSLIGFELRGSFVAEHMAGSVLCQQVKGYLENKYPEERELQNDQDNQKLPRQLV